MAKSSGNRPMSKSQVIGGIAEATGLTKKQVQAVFDSLLEHVQQELGKKGPGVFVLPGLLKLRVIRKPATKAREGVNPFTGEKTIFKAKPARNVVKATAVKALKDMVA